MFGDESNTNEVVSMMEREEAKRLAPIRAVEAYWQGLCGATEVPLRSQVDPRGMEAALENAFLIEKIAPSMAKFRVAGSHLSDLMGMQVAGMPVSTFITPEERESFGKAVERLFAEPAIARLELQAEAGFGKPSVTGHMLLMPLRSDFGDITRGLGVLVTQGRIGRTPRRFRVMRTEIRSAFDGVPRTTVLASRAPKAPDPTDALRQGFAESAKPFDPEARSHLRLVVSND